MNPNDSPLPVFPPDWSGCQYAIMGRFCSHPGEIGKGYCRFHIAWIGLSRTYDGIIQNPIPAVPPQPTSVGCQFIFMRGMDTGQSCDRQAEYVVTSSEYGCAGYCQAHFRHLSNQNRLQEESGTRVTRREFGSHTSGTVAPVFPPTSELLSNVTPDETNPCGVCLANQKNWVLLPCKHTFCGECINILHKKCSKFPCPMCIKPVESAMSFFA
jgi:hypothetical protein